MQMYIIGGSNFIIVDEVYLNLTVFVLKNPVRS